MEQDGYNLFVGSTTGMVKGVYVGKDEISVRAIAKNCVKNKEQISNKNEITCLNWASGAEEEILIGMKNKMKIFNVDSEEFSEDYKLSDGDTCGIFKSDETLFLGLTNGSIKSWKHPFNEEDLIEVLHVNKSIDKMKRSITKSNIVATGGKDNDLKLWDLNTKNTTFIAKNIKPDELQLQVPVWVSDMTFFPDSDQIASCTRHGFVRLYDPLLPQRRPVINVQQPDEVFTCLSRTPNDQQLLVGSGYGNLMLVDLRNNKNVFPGKYKGFCGAVKSVACPSNQSLVVSASLDRHFRIHDFTTRKLLVKEYMHSRLTTLLPKETFELKKFKSEIETTSLSENDGSDVENGRKLKFIERKDGEEKATPVLKKIKWKK